MIVFSTPPSVTFAENPARSISLYVFPWIYSCFEGLVTSFTTTSELVSVTVSVVSLNVALANLDVNTPTYIASPVNISEAFPSLYTTPSFERIKLSPIFWITRSYVLPVSTFDSLREPTLPVPVCHVPAHWVFTLFIDAVTSPIVALTSGAASPVFSCSPTAALAIRPIPC